MDGRPLDVKGLGTSRLGSQKDMTVLHGLAFIFLSSPGQNQIANQYLASCIQLRHWEMGWFLSDTALADQ